MLNKIIRSSLAALVLLLIGVGQSLAMSESARDWIMRMVDAGQQLNYKGNIVSIRGSQIDLMGIVHKIDAQGEQERIFSLNGMPREIVRKSGQLICYLPDKNIGLQGKLFKNQRFFPLLNNSDLDTLAEHYSFQLSTFDRIAGRQAQLVVISPKDEYRYGYKLWLDKQTGLLLRSASIDENLMPLEQYMFTQIEIGIPISDADLEPTAQAKQGLTWTKADVEPQSLEDIEMQCKFDMLPPGYKLTDSIHKPGADKHQMMNQYVFSDGLSSFSVFVEPVKEGEASTMDGSYQLGVVNVYSRTFGGSRVTMMGEVPQKTAKSVAMAVSECQ